MKLKSLDQIRKERSPDRERVDAIKHSLELEGKLHTLRELRGVTQLALAEALNVSRPNISRIENEMDLRLSTLERYIGAMGGKIRIEAVFDDQAITLIGEVVVSEPIEVVIIKEFPLQETGEEVQSVRDAPALTTKRAEPPRPS